MYAVDRYLDNFFNLALHVSPVNALAHFRYDFVSTSAIDKGATCVHIYIRCDQLKQIQEKSDEACRIRDGEPGLHESQPGKFGLILCIQH